MVKRRYWLERIEQGWKKKSVLWLSGVRRSGKTFLARSLPGIEYFDCELPRVRRDMEDPESFLKGLAGKRIVLDEIHRLADPSELLKIAADHFPAVKVLATGSSTLGASVKFKDTLTDRKTGLWLTPMMSRDLADFGGKAYGHRFLHGGLPPFYLAKEYPEHAFHEWVDDAWAKDIQELFRLERRHSFLKFAELLMVQSGGIFEATRFTGPCEVSRTTISNYLSVLEAAYLVQVLRPFSSRRSSEIIAAPKVYAFDTGFYCYYRGWRSLRDDDRGILWEHLVLNEIQARLQTRAVHYWRDKAGHEIDFILLDRRREPVCVECKWTDPAFDPAGLLAFRRRYPGGRNFLVTSGDGAPRIRHYGDVEVTVTGLDGLIDGLVRVLGKAKTKV